MSVVPNNILVQVQTYQDAELAFLDNSFAAIHLSNKKFENFNSMTANLGDTVTFPLAPRFTTTNGLVANYQPSVQRQTSLVCSQATNSSTAYTSQQMIFNLDADDYMRQFGESRVREIGTVVEADILRNAVSGVRINDPANANFGALQTESGPYRFFGDGVTQINSYGQLAQMIANFEDYGAAKGLKCILPSVNIPSVINSGLNQFTLNRNNEIANSWELGNWDGCEFYKSNLLPTHTAGTIGDAAAAANRVMTLVSTNDPTGLNVTQLTFTEPTSGTVTGAIKAGDLFEFNDGVSGETNIRYLTFIGHQMSQQKVQCRATADANTVAGSVTISITPALCWDATSQNFNLSTALSAGMQVTVAPSHRAGLLYSGNALYLAMPRLDNQEPFPSSIRTDEMSGTSIRHTWGAQLGQNNKSYICDCVWGSTLVAENSMRILFPLY